MSGKRRVIPANVLAQRSLKEMYIAPPEPEKLILAELIVSCSAIEAQGPISGLTYSLSQKLFYIDPRDADELSDILSIVSAEKKKRGRPRAKVEQ